MATSAERMRGWTGPAILSFGFRPFFLLAGIWAVLAMVLWIVMLSGHEVLPTAFDPVSWHAHEFLFGYLGAVIAGFLLTAVPNWTGRLPVTGWALAALAGLWLLGRLAVALSAGLPPLAVALADLSFAAALAAVLGREIIAGKNWRNLPVLGLLALFLAGNAGFHLAAASGGWAAGSVALRAGLAAAVMLISLIGGRIVPSFTRNWLAQRGVTRLPAPFGNGDRAVLAVTGAALLSWAFLPEAGATAVAAAVAGLAQAWRLSRWQGWRTGGEALVWVLHAGYAFVPLGFLAIASNWLGWLAPGAALHVWTAGAIGLMTLAVMTRASLGHAGRPLHAGPAIALTYGGVILSVLARFAAGIWDGQMGLLHLAATAWILAYAGFTAIYWPILTRPRAARKQPMRRPAAE